MVDNRTFFYLSGFISLVFFIFVASLFFYMLFSSDKIKAFALTKDNYISISLTDARVELKSAKKSVTAPIQKEIKKEEQVVEPTMVEAVKATPTPEVDVSNLFNNVWTKDIKKIKMQEKKIDNKRIQEIQKKIKISQENQGADIVTKITNSDEKQSNEQDSHKSAANEVNEYLAKIQALVYTYFHPPENSQGNSVRVVIELSTIGKVLDFRVLNYSSNSALNEECDRMKQRLMNVVFPVNPENKSGNYIIILTSKE